MINIIDIESFKTKKDLLDKEFIEEMLEGNKSEEVINIEESLENEDKEE